MASFDIDNTVVMGSSLIGLENDDDDMEWAYFLGCLEPEKPIFSGRFSMDTFSEAEFLSNFRFARADFRRLRVGLGLPQLIRLPNSSVVEGDEALCVVLRRLAYPNRLVDLGRTFHRQVDSLSRVFNTTLKLIFDLNNHRLNQLRQPWCSFDTMSTAVANAGSPLQRCFGFMDGTSRAMCIPKEDQREVYSGHKREHCLKYQTVMLPNGIILNAFGPVEGRRHDAFMLGQSGLLRQLQEINQHLGEPVYLYADQAYPLRDTLMCPFRGMNLTPREEHFNRTNSSLRMCVEWGYRDIITKFAFPDFKKNQKLHLQPLGVYYLVMVLLTNCHACLYGNTTSTYFALQTPQLEEYLN